MFDILGNKYIEGMKKINDIDIFVNFFKENDINVRVFIDVGLEV